MDIGNLELASLDTHTLFSQRFLNFFKYILKGEFRINFANA